MNVRRAQTDSKVCRMFVVVALHGCQWCVCGFSVVVDELF